MTSSTICGGGFALCCWSLGIGKLKIDSLPRHRDDEHEDDEENEEHVDHRCDVDVVREPAAPSG
jgi:hypothetical protein